MNNADAQYINLCRDILATGNVKGDRTGTGTLSKFGHQMRFDLSEGFPLLTTKAVHFHSVVGELLWFLRGDTNTQFLEDNKVTIWRKFQATVAEIGGILDSEISDLAKGIQRIVRSGDVGEMYGKQWRCHEYIDHEDEEYHHVKVDQIAGLIKEIKSNPDSRRLVVSAWDIKNLPDASVSPKHNVINGKAALPPCHYAFECYVANGKLSLKFTMRSNDMFLGNPFNIASYGLLTHMLTQVCNLEVGELIWSGGDCHIYSNHVEQMKTQIARFDNGEVYALPTLKLDKSITDIDDFSFEHIEILNYKSGTAIKGAIAI